MTANGKTREEAVQPLRERNMSRVVKGAQELGMPVDDLSSRQRRILAAVTALPQPWDGTRPWRTEGEAFSRHLTALRARLDWLVKLEEDHGDEQRGAPHNRAERNALVFTLRQFAEEAGLEVARSQSAGERRYDPAYVARVHELAQSAIADGFTETQESMPGMLINAAGDSREVPVATWCLVRGYGMGREAT